MAHNQIDSMFDGLNRAGIIAQNISDMLSTKSGILELTAPLLFVGFAVIAAASAVSCHIGLQNVDSGNNKRGTRQISFAKDGMICSVFGFAMVFAAFLIL